MAGMTISPSGACCCDPCAPNCTGEAPDEVCIAIDGLTDRTDLALYEQCDDCTFVNGKKYQLTTLGDCGGGVPWLNCWSCFHPSAPAPGQSLNSCYDFDFVPPAQRGYPYRASGANAPSLITLKAQLESGTYYLYAYVTAGANSTGNFRAVYRADLGASQPTCADAYGDQDLALVRYEHATWNSDNWTTYSADDYLGTDCNWGATTLETFAGCDEDEDRYNCGCEPGTEPGTLTLTLDPGVIFTEAVSGAQISAGYVPSKIDLSGSYLLVKESLTGPCAADCSYYGEFSISPFRVQTDACVNPFGNVIWPGAGDHYANAIAFSANFVCLADGITFNIEWLSDTSSDYTARYKKPLGGGTVYASDYSADFEEQNHRADCGTLTGSSRVNYNPMTDYWPNPCAPSYTPECSRRKCIDIYPDWPRPGEWCNICPEWTVP